MDTPVLPRYNTLGQGHTRLMIYNIERPNTHEQDRILKRLMGWNKQLEFSLYKLLYIDDDGLRSMTTPLPFYSGIVLVLGCKNKRMTILHFAE
jgi:hypothetical protein